MLSTVVLSIGASLTTVSADTTDSKIAQQDKTIASAQSAKDQAQAQMASLQAKVDTLKASQQDAKAKLANLQAQANKLNQQVKVLRKNISERNASLMAQARSAQVNGSATNYVGALLDSKSLTDAIQKVTAMATVSSANKQMLDQQKKDEVSLDNKLQESQKNVGKADALVQQLSDQAKEVSTRQAQLQVATVNYQLTITTAQGKKKSLLAEKAKAEAAAKAAAEKEAAYEAQQKKAAEDAAASEKAATAATTTIVASSSSTTRSSSATSTPAASTASSSTSSSSKTTSTPSSSSTTPSSSKTEPSSSNTTDSSSSSSSTNTTPGGYTNYNGSNNYAANNCTWYVWNYYAGQGVYLPASMGNGADWASGPLAHTGKVAGAIVSFAGGTYIDATYPGGGRASFTTSGAYGHVGVVLKVNSDGSYLMGSGSTSGGWQQIIVKASVPGTYLWP